MQHKLDSSGRTAVTCKEGGGRGKKKVQSSVKLGQRQQQKEMSGQANTSRAGRDERQSRGCEAEEGNGWKMKGVTR